MVEVLKVSSKSNPNSVAGALAGVLRQTGAVEVQVVGAGALNQAIKAIAIARGFVAPSNLDLVCIPTFADILIDGQSRTAIRLAVEDRSRRKPEAVAESHASAPTVDAVSATPLPESPPAPTLTPPPPRPPTPPPVPLTAGPLTAGPLTAGPLTASTSAGTIGVAAGLAVDPDAADVHAPASSEPVLT